MDIDNGYDVLVQTDDAGRITAINSSAFVAVSAGWQVIDHGSGDKCHHAQGNYLDAPLMDMHGRLLWRLVDGKTERIPEDEMPPIVPPTPAPTIEELIQRIASAEEALATTDDAAIALYEAQSEQESINIQQDESLMEIYEMIGG